MTTSRQDAWTPDEDFILAELVLAHIREGSTQLKAFEEAGIKLKRTAAACGFRWNSNIRKQYKKGIDFAKKQRKESKKQSTTASSEQNNEDNVKVEQNADSSILPEVTNIFEKIESELKLVDQYKNENSKLKSETEILQQEKLEVEKRLETVSKEYQQLREDYHSLMSLLDKARKMAIELTE